MTNHSLLKKALSTSLSLLIFSASLVSLPAMATRENSELVSNSGSDVGMEEVSLKSPTAAVVGLEPARTAGLVGRMVGGLRWLTRGAIKAVQHSMQRAMAPFRAQEQLVTSDPELEMSTAVQQVPRPLIYTPPATTPPPSTDSLAGSDSDLSGDVTVIACKEADSPDSAPLCRTTTISPQDLEAAFDGAAVSPALQHLVDHIIESSQPLTGLQKAGHTAKWLIAIPLGFGSTFAWGDILGEGFLYSYLPLWLGADLNWYADNWDSYSGIVSWAPSVFMLPLFAVAFSCAIEHLKSGLVNAKKQELTIANCTIFIIQSAWAVSKSLQQVYLLLVAVSSPDMSISSHALIKFRMSAAPLAMSSAIQTNDSIGRLRKNAERGLLRWQDPERAEIQEMEQKELEALAHAIVKMSDDRFMVWWKSYQLAIQSTNPREELVTCLQQLESSPVPAHPTGRRTCGALGVGIATAATYARWVAANYVAHNTLRHLALVDEPTSTMSAYVYATLMSIVAGIPEATLSKAAYEEFYDRLTSYNADLLEYVDHPKTHAAISILSYLEGIAIALPSAGLVLLAMQGGMDGAQQWQTSSLLVAIPYILAEGAVHAGSFRNSNNQALQLGSKLWRGSCAPGERPAPNKQDILAIINRAKTTKTY